MNLNVLKTVNDFIANPDKNFGFLLRNSKLSQEIDIATSQFDLDSSFRPKLIIEYPASTGNLTQNRVGYNCMHRQVSLTTVNLKVHITNNSVTPVYITLSRLDGTTVASEMLLGGMRKILSTRSAGVYLLSVSGNKFTVYEKVSLFR